MSRLEVWYLETRPGQGRALTRRLRSRSFQVRSLPASEASPEEIRASPPDVLLWDLGAAGSGGLASLPRLQALCPELPILVLASNASVSLAREAVRLGAQRLLSKPVRTAEVELAIHQAVEQGRGGAGARNLDRLEFANRQLAALNEVSNRFSRIRDEDELLESVPRLLAKSLEFDRGVLFLHDGERLKVRSVCFAKDPPEFEERFLARIRSGELPFPPPMQEAFDRDETLFVADPNTHPRWPRAPGEVIRTRSMVISPIRCQEKPIGILVGNMQHHERPMDPQDVARFEMFTNMVGLALDNIRTYQGLERTVAERTQSLLEAQRVLDDQLRSILDAAPIPLLVSRLSDGRILYANEREAVMIGLPRDELIGLRSVDFYHDPGERPRLMAKLKESGRLDDVEVCFHRADGEVVWAIFAMVLAEFRGETVIVSGSYDVTRRKLAEDALEKERNFVSAVLDTAGALVVVLDTAGRVVRFNRACERITGYSFEEVRGKPFPEIFLLPEERPEVEQAFAALLSGEPRLERRNHWRTRSGELRLIEWSNTTLTGEDGRVEYVVSTGIDVTERHQARQKLKLYRQIFDRSYDGIVVLDSSGRFVERNPIHRVLSGFSDEDLIGRSAADLFGRDVVHGVMNTVRETGSYRGELMAPKADGTETPIDVSVFSILNDAGDILYYVAIGRDITERKRAEEELRRAHDDLEQRVEARTAELARLNEKLVSEVLERKQAEDALRRSHELLTRQNAVLAEFSKRLSPERGNLQILMGELTRAASATLSVARVSVWMYREDQSFIECLDLYDAGSDRHEQGQRLHEVDYPSYFLALGEHRAIAAHDAHRDPRTREFSESYLAPLGIRSMLDAPIWLEGRMVGVLCHEHVGPPRHWTPEEERFAASVADFAALTLEAHQRFRAEEELRKAHDELETRVEQRTAQLARMNVAYRDEIHERRHAQEALAVRLRYEEGLSACSKTLLTESDSVTALPEALRHLLLASEASRVYLCENVEDEDGGLSIRPRYEIGSERRGDDGAPPAMDLVPYEALAGWRTELSSGRAVGGVVSRLPPSQRELLGSLNLRSILALPLFVDGAWYGFMGFLDFERERQWSKEDIRSLETGAEMVGVYLGRKRAAEALRVSEQRFRTLVENANDIIFSMNPDGTLTYLSPKFTEATQYEVEEFLGKTLFPMMHPEDQSRARHWLEEGLEREERFSGYEFRFRHKNGEWRWWVATASVLYGEDRRPREIIGVSHDFTRMKQVFEDLERANRELREAQAQLVQSEKMASLGMLVAGIAHEINTPVGAIRSMHDTLMRALHRLETSLTREHPDVLASNPSIQSTLMVVQDANRVIDTASERVTGIVRRLRSFARLDESELKEADLNEGLEDTLVLIHHLLKHDIVVHREYGAIPRIACHPGRLNQVFLNLLNNARQAIPGKGEITIRTFARDGRVHVVVSDTGTGIRPEHLKKIFDPGFTTKGVGVGTGLGLSICYQIVQDHGGEITVESEPGRGAHFTVVLPMSPDEKIPQAGTGIRLEAS